MRPCPAVQFRFVSCLAAGLVLAAAGCSRGPDPAATPPRGADRSADGQQGQNAADRDGTPRVASGAPLVVPPLPDGSPEELLEFVTKLQTTQVQPRSQEEMVGYVKGICSRGIEAANRILGAVPADDPNAAKAGRLKLESLLMLSEFEEGDKARDDAAAYAQSLADGPTPALSRLGRRTLITLAAQKAFGVEDIAAVVAAIPDLVARTADVLAADPDDAESVKLAASLARAAERAEVPGKASPAIAAYATFAEILAKSTEPDIRTMAEGMAGASRRLDLPGKPMKLEGTRLDGTAFDPKPFAGKVVLVDFWATWCGPCLEEIPNILAQYTKYHDKGFEVLAISIDESREDLDAFLAEQKLPWPVLFSGQGWKDPVARFYGINGIPQLILVGRDGNVISTTARGERLGELLAEQFKDADAAEPRSDASP